MAGADADVGGCGATGAAISTGPPLDDFDEMLMCVESNEDPVIVSCCGSSFEESLRLLLLVRERHIYIPQSVPSVLLHVDTKTEQEFPEMDALHAGP